MDIRKQLELGKETIALRITNRLDPGSDFAEILVKVVYADPEKGNTDDSIGFYNNYIAEKHQYKGLQVSCIIDSDPELSDRWKLAVNTSVINLGEAEDIVKTLRPVERKLDRITATEGVAECFDEYISRLCRVLGAKAFYCQSPNHSQYQRNDDIGDLREHLRYQIKQNRLFLSCDSDA